MMARTKPIANTREPCRLFWNQKEDARETCVLAIRARTPGRLAFCSKIEVILISDFSTVERGCSNETLCSVEHHIVV